MASGSSSTERARRTNSSENIPLRGSAPRRSTFSMVDQPALSTADRLGDQRTPRTRDHGRARRRQDAGTLVPPCPLGDHIDRAVGGCALFTVGLVMGIEHDGSRQAWERGPCGRPAPDHDGPTRPRPGPIGRGQVAAPHQAGAQTLGPTDRGHDHQHPTRPGRSGRVVDHGENDVEQIRGRRQPKESRSFTAPDPHGPHRPRRQLAHLGNLRERPRPLRPRPLPHRHRRQPAHRLPG